MTNIGNNLIKNSFYSIAAKFVAMVMYLFIDAYIARILTISEYGEWSFFYSVISIAFWIIWCGINTSTKVYVAENKKNIILQNSYIKSAIVLRILVSILIASIFLFFIEPLSYILDYPEKYPNMLILLRIGVVHIILNSFSEFFKDLYVGMIKFSVYFGIIAIEYIGYGVFGLGLMAISKFYFKSHCYLVFLAVGYCLALLCVSIFGIYTIIQYFKKFAIEQRGKCGKKLMVDIFCYAKPILIMSFGSLLLLEMDTLMIGKLYIGKDIAIYAVAKKLCSKTTQINWAICLATMTPFAIINRQNIIERKHLFRKLLIINGILSACVVFGFLFCGDFAIRKIYGSDYSGAAFILKLLIPYYLLFTFGNYFSTILDYQHKAKKRSKYYLITIVTNLVFNVLLIPKYGGVGAAIATSLSLIPYTVCIILQTYKVFEQN